MLGRQIKAENIFIKNSMDKVYRAIITGQGIYKEIDLLPEYNSVKLGTTIACNVRVYRDLVFEDFEVDFLNRENEWFLNCSDNLYIYSGDVRKLHQRLLSDGERLEIRYRDSNAPAFSVEFDLNFNYDEKLLYRQINIKGQDRISIGSHQNTSILLNTPYTKDTSLVLERKNQNCLHLDVKNSGYGVTVNGVKNEDTVCNKDFFSIGDVTFYYDEPFLWTELRDDIIIRQLNWHDELYQENYPCFTRNARVRQLLDKEEIEVLDPPEKPTKPKTNLLLSLMPSMGMMITSGLMATMGGSMMIYSGASGAMAIVTAVATMVSNNRNYKKELQERITKYHHYTAEKRKEIESERSKELKMLQDIYIDQEKEHQYVDEFSYKLFDRHTGDEDFLHVRIGTGIIPSLRQVNYKKQQKLEIEDDLQMIPVQICKEYKNIGNAPVICNLKTANSIAVIGDRENRYSFMKTMIYDICTRHFPSEVELCFLASEQDSELVRGFRFLPHVQSDDKVLRDIAFEDADKSRLYDKLFKDLSGRNKEYTGKHFVIFLFDEYGILNHPVSRFIERASEYAATFVFFTEERGKAPIGCSQLIVLDKQNKGLQIRTEDKTSSLSFIYTDTSDDRMQALVTKLAPVYAEEISLQSDLIKNISLFRMLGIFSVTDLDLQKRWNLSKAERSMSAPIGVTKTGTVFLDLHDKAHGPHGLVAGTTGSGKSELLQTYILSIATLYHPHEISFVIIDFKGGGMVNQFRNLPHLLGAITNIDGKEIDRSLKSIKAELQKRQRLFAEADVNHIDKYIVKYKSGEVSEPIPHLILIVDEFAELKAEQPEFMAELISAARIGRSLGVHLILATQKPSGQVDDQIWSNSRFKLCLKVQDASDSNEVLKSPLAAEIKEPGRAYLQVGNNEIFELFQSAYSGAPERMDDSKQQEFDIFKVSTSGSRTLIYRQKKEKKASIEATQLDAIVQYVHEYCEQQQIAQLPDICLPPLSDVVNYPLSSVTKEGFYDIGIYDDPDQQIQESSWIDLDTKHTFILGSSQFGKTNLLQSMIRAITVRATPEESVIYIIDFGSMVLRAFEELNHVGGVVTSSEDEKLKNLFKLLFGEIQSRKTRLIEAGVSSHSAYIEAGFRDIPHIYLMIDNLTALIELYLEDNDSLLQILREGLAVGISVIISNTATTGISYRYLSNFANKICFYCNDNAEYMNMFDHSVIPPDEKPGRCLLEMDKRCLECQTYLAFEGEREIDRVGAIQEYIQEINTRCSGKRARKIPFIPDVLSVSLLYDDYEAKATEYNLPIGLTYSDVKPFYLDIAQIGVVGLCGKDGSGQAQFLHYVMETLEKRKDIYPVNVVVFDDVKRSLSWIKDFEIISQYVIGTEDAETIIAEWHQILEQRYDALADTGILSINNEMLLMIIQNNDLAKRIDENMDLQYKFNDIVGRFAGMNIAVVFTNYPNASVSYDAPEALRKVKEDQHLLFFDDLDNLKPFDVSFEDLRANKKKLNKGDGYYICENTVVKLKMVSNK